MGRGLGGAVAAGTLLACAAPIWAPEPAQAQAVRVDARAEAIMALYGASAAKDAAERRGDASLREMRAQIEALAAQGARARTQMIAAQERYLSALGEGDFYFAQNIESLRNAVVCIASAPEGAAALARFNAGDELAALAALDQANAAHVDGRDRTNTEMAAARRCVAGLALEALARGKLDANAVIARYEETTRLDPGDFSDWRTLSALYRETERLAYARRAAERAYALAGDEAITRAAAAFELGKVLAAQRDYAGARRRYEESLAIAQWLTTEDEGFANERGLSEVFARLGDALFAQGDFTGARGRYEESRTIVRRFAETNPGSLVVQRDLLSASLKVAEAITEQRDFAAARTGYLESLAVARRVDEMDHRSVRARQDVAEILGKLGEVLVKNGDLPGARDRFAECMGLLRALAGAEGASASAQQDVMARAARLGDVLMALGDLAGARARYEEALAVARRLSERNAPGAHAEIVRNLARLGDVQLGQRDYQGARARLDEGMGLARTLAARSPNSSEAEQDLTKIQFHLGELDLASMRADAARARFTQAASALRALLQRSPQDRTVRLALVGAEFRLAQSQADRAGVSRAIHQLRALDGLRNDVLGARWISELKVLARAEEPD